MATFENMGRTVKQFSAVPAQTVGQGADAPDATAAPVAPPVGVNVQAPMSEPEHAPEVYNEASAVVHIPFTKHATEATVSVQKNNLDRVSESPVFTVVGVDLPKVSEFAREYNQQMNTVRCVADTSMLLQYMVETERKYNVTLSFPAYGVDPIVFDEAASVPDEDGTQPAVVAVKNKRAAGVDGADDEPMYEKVEVDGVLYFSCISECLNKDYLHKVITEATESVYMHNQYVYTLVGPRPLTNEDALKGNFIETLKLNSFELSVLVMYMSGIEGVVVKHGVFDGRSAIMFER